MSNDERSPNDSRRRTRAEGRFWNLDFVILWSFSEMPHDLRTLQFRQVGGNIFFDLGPHVRFEFRQELVIDLPAGGQQTTLHVLVSRQRVEALGKQANQTLA